MIPIGTETAQCALRCIRGRVAVIRQIASNYEIAIAGLTDGEFRQRFIELLSQYQQELATLVAAESELLRATEECS